MTAVTIPASDHAPVIVSRDPADFPVPTGREEEWRFTPLARLRGLHLDPVATGVPEITWDADPGVGVEIVGRDDARLGRLVDPIDRVLAQAWQNFERAVVITVPADHLGSRDTLVRITTPAGISFGHVVIDVGRFARAGIVVEWAGTGTFAGTVEAIVGDSAELRHVSVHDAQRDAVHVVRQHTRLGRDARLVSSAITLGGDVVRYLPTVDYAAPGGDAELLGVFFSDSGQHHEHRVFVDHAQPHCRSSVVYKGALQGDGTHAVWIGDVLVRAQAIGIDTYEVNRNLLLSDGARADSVPNLELETGEIVGAGHASATGRFDDEQLFYLQARGIPADIARVLVVRGFFADVVARMGVPSIAERTMAAIDERLGVETADIETADTETADIETVEGDL